ncbi:MAG: hypothetical protein H7321_03665 [Bacteroidia bacterium]|nr:hypothetical protein [Bacteroidia bacterium]
MIICNRLLLDILTFRNRKVNAMALWPFIIFKDKDTSADPFILNHEKIHHRQQLELLLIPYYLWYFIEYWTGMLYYRNHDKAYRNISFEKEAYANQNNLDYLKKRPFLNSVKWL